MGTINYSEAIKPDAAYIKKIIENSLLSVWAIRIEYLGHDAETAGWQLWGKTLFALRSASPVMTGLVACYEKHSSGAIRIAAERFRPQTRLIYTVYTPHILPEETICKPQTITHKNPWGIDQPYAQTSLST